MEKLFRRPHRDPNPKTDPKLGPKPIGSLLGRTESGMKKRKTMEPKTCPMDVKRAEYTSRALQKEGFGGLAHASPHIA